MPGGQTLTPGVRVCHRTRPLRRPVTCSACVVLFPKCSLSSSLSTVSFLQATHEGPPDRSPRAPTPFGTRSPVCVGEFGSPSDPWVGDRVPAAPTPGATLRFRPLHSFRGGHHQGLVSLRRGTSVGPGGWILSSGPLARQVGGRENRLESPRVPNSM